MLGGQPSSLGRSWKSEANATVKGLATSGSSAFPRLYPNELYAMPLPEQAHSNTDLVSYSLR